MADIVAFKPRTVPDGPHASGEAACECGHEWVGVAPIGVTALECPSCGTMNGKWKHPFGPADGDVAFLCQCGADTFFFKQSAVDGRTLIICTGCGDFKGIDDVFPLS